MPIDFKAIFTYVSLYVGTQCMGIFMAKTYLFDIGRLNILQDSHKYLVQYMFLHFHRQGHIGLIKCNVGYMGMLMLQNPKTYNFHIGLRNIQADIHKYSVQYRFHFHRQGHIWLRLNICSVHGHIHGANTYV